MITPGRVLRNVHFFYRRWLESIRHGSKLGQIEAIVAVNEPAHLPDSSPVVFFNASTRIWGLSLNAAFSLLASWGLRLSGVPVTYYVCNSGMEQCILGTIRSRLEAPPSCSLCARLSGQMYPDRLTDHLEPPGDGWEGRSAIEYGETLDELRHLEEEGLLLGELCYPSLRWVLRRHNIQDSPAVRNLYRKYLRTGIHIARNFRKLIDERRPQAVVVFNGVTYPEAIVRQVALQKGLPVVTHEVGVRPFSGFFTHGEATAYPISIADDFALMPEDETILDEYLSRRFQGAFGMAGVNFWPEMRDLDGTIIDRAKTFRQIASVFTNVIFDTSQVHANIVFPDMFVWLEKVIAFANEHPETLFVIRAHPDELRPGKQSLETVEQHLKSTGAFDLDNVFFIPPREFIDSYELIRRSKLVQVYNSSIGLEATILGRVVLCAGKSRYTDYPTAYFPRTPEEYFQLSDKFLEEDNPVAPDEFIYHARRFIYYQHFYTSLDFSPFLRAHPKFPGYSFFTEFDPLELHMDRCEEIKILHDGIVNRAPLVYREAHLGDLSIA